VGIKNGIRSRAGIRISAVYEWKKEARQERDVLQEIAVNVHV